MNIPQRQDKHLFTFIKDGDNEQVLKDLLFTVLQLTEGGDIPVFLNIRVEEDSRVTLWVRKIG